MKQREMRGRMNRERIGRCEWAGEGDEQKDDDIMGDDAEEDDVEEYESREA